MNYRYHEFWNVSNTHFASRRLLSRKLFCLECPWSCTRTTSWPLTSTRSPASSMTPSPRMRRLSCIFSSCFLFFSPPSFIWVLFLLALFCLFSLFQNSCLAILSSPLPLASLYACSKASWVCFPLPCSFNFLLGHYNSFPSLTYSRVLSCFPLRSTAIFIPVFSLYSPLFPHFADFFAFSCFSNFPIFGHQNPGSGYESALKSMRINQ